MDKHKHIEGMMEKLKELNNERDKLLIKLDRSLAIRNMWPEVVFPCTSHMEGSANKGFRFVITSKTGETKEFGMDQIPPILQTGKIKEGLDFIRRWSK